MFRQSRLDQFLISKGLVTVPDVSNRVQNRVGNTTQNRLNSLLLNYVK
nr:MAG TPA: hypothetical protein [Caudoviricetes sp.]